MKKILIALSLVLIGFTATQGTFAYEDTPLLIGSESMLTNAYENEVYSIYESNITQSNLEDTVLFTQIELLDVTNYYMGLYKSTELENVYYVILNSNSTDMTNQLLLNNETYLTIQGIEDVGNNVLYGSATDVASTQEIRYRIVFHVSEQEIPYQFYNYDGATYTPNGNGNIITDKIAIPIETNIFDALGGMATGFVGLLSALVVGDASVTSLFYTDADGLKIMGILALMAFGYGMVKMAFYFTKRLISLRG